jgi:hypothetical protein
MGRMETEDFRDNSTPRTMRPVCEETLDHFGSPGRKRITTVRLAWGPPSLASSPRGPVRRNITPLSTEIACLFGAFIPVRYR